MLQSTAICEMNEICYMPWSSSYAKAKQKYKSDEETDDENCGTLIRRSPGWRSAASTPENLQAETQVTLLGRFLESSIYL